MSDGQYYWLTVLLVCCAMLAVWNVAGYIGVRLSLRRRRRYPIRKDQR